MTAADLLREAAEPKPCPFCGGMPEMTKHFKLDIYGLIHRCKIVGPIIFEHGDREHHIARWNTRAAADRAPEGRDAVLEEAAAAVGQYARALSKGALPRIGSVEGYGERFGEQIRALKSSAKETG